MEQFLTVPQYHIWTRLKFMAKKKSDTNANKNGATLGFEAILYQAADKLRNNMDAAEYKHVVLGLIFLKYISDSFEEKYNFLLKEFADPNSESYINEETARYDYAEDRDEYFQKTYFSSRRKRAGHIYKLTQSKQKLGN